MHSAPEKRRRCRCGHPIAAAGKPEAQAEGIRVASPETAPHSLGSRLGLQGTGPPNPKTDRHAHQAVWRNRVRVLRVTPIQKCDESGMNGGESAEGVARAANAWKRRSETAATKSHPARSEVRGHGRGCPYHVAGLWEQAQAWMPERRGHAVTAGRAPIRHRRIGRGRRERPEAWQEHPRLTGPPEGQRLA